MSVSSDDSSAPSESFFGLIVKPNKRYDTVVKKAFRISKACIEPATMGGDKVTSLYLEYDGEEFIIANLHKGHLSDLLDLSFNLNEKISFKVDGPGTVHLTGNTIDEDEPPGMDDFLDDDEMESASEVEEEETPEPKQKKRKNEANKKEAKKIKLDSTATSNGKADDEESSDDDSDDSSDETGAETTTLSDLDSTTNFAEEEDSDDSDDEGGEEEEGSDDDSEEESEAEESPAKPAKTNGDVSPSKKAKLEAKAKADSPKKQVEMTPKNKKEGKPDKTPKQENKTPKAEGKTPKAEGKTPKAEGKTPKADGKTPKAEAKTPKAEAKTPKVEAKTPKQDGKTPKQDSKTPKQEGKTPKKFSLGGVTVEDTRVGTGPDVKKGKMMGMYYAGRLQSNNKQFDACQSGKPFKFRLGAGEVIKGWDTGIMGMKVGGKRKLTIPANLAYGSRGAPPDIPPNATLVFDIECKYCNWTEIICQSNLINQPSSSQDNLLWCVDKKSILFFSTKSVNHPLFGLFNCEISIFFFFELLINISCLSVC